MKLVLLGPPGSGKGTQAKVLAQTLNALHIAPGDIFRREVKERTELGLMVESIMARGELVDDSVTVKIIGKELEEEAGAKGFIFDGFPRNLYQAEALESLLNGLGMKLDMAINIVVSDQELLKRGMARRVCRGCGRPYNLDSLPPKTEGVCDVCGGELYQRDDDKEAAMRERFRIYREATEPLVDYYRKKGILYVVDGEKTVEEVTSSILEGISHFR